MNDITPAVVEFEPYYRSSLGGANTLSPYVLKEGDIVMRTSTIDAEGDVQVVTDAGHLEWVAPDCLTECSSPAALARWHMLAVEIEAAGDLEGALEGYSRRLSVRRELIAGRGKRCSSCDELKHAYHFAARPDGSRYGECRSCAAAAKRARRLVARQAADAVNGSRADV